jgi:hypothetical protein
MHFDNDGLDDLGDELDDVGQQYKKLDGSKWDKAYTKAWDAATDNK